MVYNEMKRLTTPYNVNPIIIDGKYFSKFQKINLNNISTKYKIIKSSVELLSQCHNTQKLSDERRKVGLVIGRIQSGKTTFFLSAVAMALDNGFEIITIFTGTKNNLKEQTYYRVNKNFPPEVFSDVKILDSSHFLIKDDMYNERDFANQINNNIRLGKKIIIIGLKHYKHINAIKSVLSKLDKRFNHLIIDDEGDQASLNSKVNKNDYSTTYRSFIELKNALVKVSFISVTATPQANLFIDTMDMLSPDFCVLIEPGDGYVGGEVFHGELEDKLIKNIPDIDKNEVLEEIIPESLDEAIRVFIIGSVIKTLRDDHSNHSMLIHPSYLTKDHTKIYNIVNSFIKHLKGLFKFDCDDDMVVLELKKFSNAYFRMMNDFNYGIDFNIISYNIQNEIQMCGVKIINSAAEYEDSRDQLYSNIIYIGGNMVERGLTIDNLAVTYITRHPSSKGNIDTILQRARWFGYKKDYIDLCRVFCIRDIQNAFSSILAHEIDLWETINFAIVNNLDLKKYTFSLVIENENLNITRKSVINHKNTNQYYFGVLTQKYFVLDSVRQSTYVEMIADIFSKNSIEVIHKNNQTDLKAVLSKIELEEFISFLVVNKLIKDSKIIKWLKFILINNEQVPIYLMRYKINGKVFRSIRKFRQDTSIINLLQGKSLKGSNIYPGDRNVYNDHSNIQVHLVHPRDPIIGIDKVPYIAISIPKKDGKVIAERRVRYES